MVVSVKTPPLGRKSTTGTPSIFCPRLESHKAPAQWGEWVTKAGISLSALLLSLLNKSPFPCYLVLFRAKKLVPLRLHTSSVTLQQATMAANTPNVHIIDASIQSIIFLVKFFHRTSDEARHREQPARSPTSQGVKKA